MQAYEEHVWDVYGFLAYRTRSRAEAEDLTQLTFERAWKSWDRFDERRAKAKTWLLAIAQNVQIDDQRRARSRREGVPGDWNAAEDPRLSQPGPEQSLGLSPELEVAIERLSRREREVVALRFGADLRGPEIAEMLGLSLANAQQILSRALRKLRAVLEPGDAQGAGPAAAAGRGAGSGGEGPRAEDAQSRDPQH